MLGFSDNILVIGKARGEHDTQAIVVVTLVIRKESFSSVSCWYLRFKA